MNKTLSLLLILAVFFFMAPFRTQAAGISYDANLAASVTSGSSQTISFTTSGSNRYLVVGVLVQGGQSVTGCTYAGVGMTQLTSQSASDVSSSETDYLYGLANPASGANNIVCTYSGSATNAITASDFNGAQQTTAVEAYNSSQNTGSSITVSVTTLTNNDWLVGFARSGGTTSAGSNTTIRGAAGNINMMDSNAAQTPAGSHSLSFTGAAGMASQVIALQPVAASTVTPLVQFYTFGF